MSHTTFGRRVTKLADKHRLLSGGVTYKVGPDGLITAYPERRYAPRFPLLGVLGLLVGAFAFKVVLFVASGEAPYSERLAELAAGGPVERSLAWVMQPDQVTQVIARVADAALRWADLP